MGRPGARCNPALAKRALLPAIQGGEYGPSKLKGKNILILFPRGKVDDHWCQVYHYQYADLAQLETTGNLRRTYNLEILLVLPERGATAVCPGPSESARRPVGDRHVALVAAALEGALRPGPVGENAPHHASLSLVPGCSISTLTAVRQWRWSENVGVSSRNTLTG